MTSDEPDGDDGLTPAQRAEVKKLVANETEEAETTRRGALKVGGSLLGLGLLGGGGLAASSGSAQAGDDQVGDAGSQAAPLDFFAEDLYDKNGNRVAELPGDGSLDVLQDLSAQSVNTDQVTTNKGGTNKEPANRPLVSNEPRTITVGTDTDTIQEALDMVPRILRHEWMIDIQTDTYNEDFYFAGLQGIDLTHTYNGEPQGASRALKIRGDTTNPSNVQVNSGYIASCLGNANPAVAGIEFTGETPYNNDGGSLQFQSVQSGAVRDVSFTSDPDTGIMCYNGTIKVGGLDAGTDFGTGNVTNAFLAKRGGTIIIRGDPGVTGSTTGAAHVATSGEIYTNFVSGNNVTGSPDFRTKQQGVIYDTQSNRIIGWSGGTGATAYQTSDQTLTTGANTKLAWGGTDYNDGAFDLSNNEYTVADNMFGKYEASLVLKIDGISAGTSVVPKVYVNGSQQAGKNITADGGSETFDISRTFDLAFGDTISFQVYHDEGADLLTDGQHDWTYCTIKRVGP